MSKFGELPFKKSVVIEKWLWREYKMILTGQTNSWLEMFKTLKAAGGYCRNAVYGDRTIEELIEFFCLQKTCNVFESRSSGQAAIEYMIVLGIALLLAAPFVLKAQSSIVDLRSDSNAVSVQNSLNDIEVAAETVNAAGEPAARTFPVRLPETLERTWVLDNAVVIQIDTPGPRSNFSRTFDFNVSGGLPDQPGRYMLKTEANGSEVVLEVVS